VAYERSDEFDAVELMAEGHQARRSVCVQVETSTTGLTQAVGHGDSSMFGRQGLSTKQAHEPELAGASEGRSRGWVDEVAELGGSADASAFEESKAGSVGKLEQTDVYSSTYTMSG